MAVNHHRVRSPICPKRRAELRELMRSNLATSTDNGTVYHDFDNSEQGSEHVTSAANSNEQDKPGPSNSHKHLASSPDCRKTSTEARSSNTFQDFSNRPSSSFDISDKPDLINLKDKKKVSFLSRFLASGKKRSSSNIPLESQLPDRNAFQTEEFSSAQQGLQNSSNLDHIPKMYQPSSYTKVKIKNKVSRDFDKLLLVQELSFSQPSMLNKNGESNKQQTQSHHQNHHAIRSLKFSLDGKYLAGGGEDKTIRIWSVISSEAERDLIEAEEAELQSQNRIQLIAPIFSRKPIKVYEDHESAILDLQWSKNNFLLSTSQDKTIRLYHPSRFECLCTFKHASTVFAIAFHPKDDRFFLAGCKDGKLRLWSVPDKRIEYWVNIGDMITSVTFSPDGRIAFAGTVTGAIHTFATESLKTLGQIPVRSKKKSRITGMEVKCFTPSTHSTDTNLKLLVTTTDSRIRLYNLHDKSLELKLKSHKNDELMIRACTSDDCKFILSPSEDKSVYVWSITESLSAEKQTQPEKETALEYFEAGSCKITCALFAPVETKLILSESADPIYDICNPPLSSRARGGSLESSKLGSTNSLTDGQKPPVTVKIQKVDSPMSMFSPSTFEHVVGENNKFSKIPSAAERNSKSSHPSGHIIVTACANGIIRVFRQDCAYTKRYSSTAFSTRAYLRRALGSSSRLHSSSNLVNRPSSLYSNRTGSRLSANFTNQDYNMPTSGSPRPTLDRIEKWRADLEDLSLDNNGSPSGKNRANSVASSAKRSNSLVSMSTTHTAATHMSPGKSDVRLNLAAARMSPVRNDYDLSQLNSQQIRRRAQSGETSESGSRIESLVSRTPSVTQQTIKVKSTLSKPPIERNSSSFLNPLRLASGSSLMFWNVSQYDSKNPASSAQEDSLKEHVEEGQGSLIPKLSKTSMISRLTDDIDETSKQAKDNDHNDDNNNNNVHDDNNDNDNDNGDTKYIDDLEETRISKCSRCGGKDFRVKESRTWTFGKARSLICSACGLETC